MRVSSKSKTARLLTEVAQLIRSTLTESLAPLEAARREEPVRKVEALASRWNHAYAWSDGCCRRWLSSVNGTQER